MAAGGGADYADARWIEAVAAGKRTHEAQSAGGVVEFDGMVVSVGTEPVFKNVAGHAVGDEPVGVALALMLGETAVASAW